MRKPRRWLLGAGWLALVLSAVAATSEPTYVLPTAVEAHRFRLDLRTVSPNSVLLDFAVDSDGHPRDVIIRRGNGFLADLAPSLLRGWKFTLPEGPGDNPRVALFFLTRQPQLLAVEPALRDLPAVEWAAGNSPPDPRRIIDPSHPPQVVTDGLVVLGVRVSRHGSVEEIARLFGRDEFLQAAEEVVHAWEFAPARKDNEPVAGGLLVVIYSPSPS
jgi:hypothetical protein